MSKKLLVAYATRAGSTMEIADSIAKMLYEAGNQVEVKPIKAVKTLDRFDAVILGSSIRVGQLMPEVLRFVKDHKAVLQQKPVAVFAVCMTLKEDTPENRKMTEAYFTKLQKEITPATTGCFAGVINNAKLGPIARFATRNVIKAPEGDFRDWQKIGAWTKMLESRLITKE